MKKNIWGRMLVFRWIRMICDKFERIWINCKEFEWISRNLNEFTLIWLNLTWKVGSKLKRLKISLICKVISTFESILVKFSQNFPFLAFSVNICPLAPISNLVTLYGFVVKFYVKLTFFSSPYIKQVCTEKVSVF